jgi:hypothetical protein
MISGTIPAEIGLLMALKNLCGCCLSVHRPISHASQTHRDLSGNQIHGTLPSHLGQMTELVYFYVHNNQLRGTLPTELGALTSVQQL